MKSIEAISKILSYLDIIIVKNRNLMIRVRIIQTQTYRTNKEGIAKISKFLEKLGKKKTKIVCLPEQWLKNNENSDFDS